MLLLGKRRSKLVAFVLAFLHWVFNDGCSCCNAEDDDNNIRFIQLQGRVHERYPATAAAFGDPLTSQNKIYNLMLPPEDPWLCEFPQRYIPFMNNQTARETFDRDYPLPVALFISINRCSAEQKARVASLIQRNVASSLELLVLYTPIPSSKDGIQLQPDDASVTLEPDLDKIGLLHLEYQYATSIEDEIWKTSPGRSPRFLIHDNRRWSYPLQVSSMNFTKDNSNIKGNSSTEDNGSTEDNRSDEGDGSKDQNGDIDNIANNDKPRDIYWFRIMLFALLTTPFFRACYLWYSGGGRFYFQRNDEGRIVGIQYVPPMPTWLTGWLNGNSENTANQPTGTLTEQQLNDLPEIEYQRIESHYDEDKLECKKIDKQLSDEDKLQNADDSTVPVSLKENDTDDSTAKCAEDDMTLGSNQESNNNNVAISFGEDAADNNGTTPPNKSPSVTQSTTEECYGTNCNEKKTKEHDRVQILDLSPNLDMEKGVTEVEAHMSVRPAERQCKHSKERHICRSTMCSICIDDFEPGEIIILLPRCQHGFHKECIHPWLTERQGCCPFCKVDVLPLE